MIRQLYPDERSRNRALGVWAAVSGFSLALGPVLGGTLVGAWSWRGIFWFDVTFGLAALVVAALVLPESADPRAGRVDITGTRARRAARWPRWSSASSTARRPASPRLACWRCSRVRGRRRGLRALGAPRPVSAARPELPAGPAVRDPERGRVLLLLRDLRDLLLHRAVPGRGRRLLRIPDRGPVPADDCRDDRGVAAGRPLDDRARRPLVAGRRMRALRGRAAADQRGARPDPAYLPLAAALGLAGSASASASCRSPRRCWRRSPASGRAWPPRPRTPAGSSARSPASPCSARVVNAELRSGLVSR